MDERSKSYLSIIFIASAFTLPFIGLAAGWAGRNFQRGAEMALIIFWYYLLLSVVSLTSIREPSWLMVALPFCVGVLYMTIPDLVPGGLDDAIVMGVMALVTFMMWRKKQPNLSCWGIVTLLGLAAYELIGGFVPGPFDEILAAAFYAGISIIIGTRTNDKNREKISPTLACGNKDKEFSNKVSTSEEGMDIQP